MSLPKCNIVIITGRPASGKSEILNFLKNLSPENRSALAIGNIQELDDFPFVWETFEIDDILQKHNYDRLFTTSDYYFKNDRMMWTLFTERLNLEFRKRVARNPKLFDTDTVFIEFARGGERGLRDTFECLAPEILSQASILYLNISYKESLRKNRLRARPGQEDSILYHSLPDKKLDFYYRTNDWETLADAKEGLLPIKNFQVPYAVLDNEDDKTSDPEKLPPALKEVFSRLQKQRASLHD